VFTGLTGRSPLDVPLRPAGLASVLSELSDNQIKLLRQAAADVTVRDPVEATADVQPVPGASLSR